MQNLWMYTVPPIHLQKNIVTLETVHKPLIPKNKKNYNVMPRIQSQLLSVLIYRMQIVQRLDKKLAIFDTPTRAYL